MDLHAEHEALRRQVDDLQREHDRLADLPYSESMHAQHRHELTHKIKELRAHLARLQGAER
jgi:hypothetical protein